MRNSSIGEARKEEDKAAADIHKSDILVKMPFDAYDEISDYAHAREISEAGRELMKEAIDKYEH